MTATIQDLPGSRRPHGEPIISARGLTRTFGDVEAVRGLDLEVREGELVAFLGPNGAGKSTSLRMLTTLLAPTSGSAVVAGHDVVAEPEGVRRQIAVRRPAAPARRRARARPPPAAAVPRRAVDRP